MYRKSILPICTLFAAFLSGCHDASTIGVIGGADGPTSIFIAGNASIVSWLIPLLILLGIAVVGIIAYICYKRKK